MVNDYIKLKEIKPELSGYIREAHDLLRLAPVPDDKAVHDIRVLMKKSRAVMRLIGNQMENNSYSREYKSFREVGRLMCSLRDTSVHRRTLKQIRKSYPELFSRIGSNEKVRGLMEKVDAKSVLPHEAGAALEKSGAILTKAGFRLRFESLGNLDPHLLLQELDKTFTIALDKYILCRNNPKHALVHEFRKKAKDLLYQLYFFRPLNPPAVKSVEKKLDMLTRNLGKYNDHSQLIDALDYKYSPEAGNPAMDEFVIIIRQEQEKYLLNIWPVAYRIFRPGQKLVNLLGYKILTI